MNTNLKVFVISSSLPVFMITFIYTGLAYSKKKIMTFHLNYFQYLYHFYLGYLAY